MLYFNALIYQHTVYTHLQIIESIWKVTYIHDAWRIHMLHCVTLIV